MLFSLIAIEEQLKMSMFNFENIEISDCGHKYLAWREPQQNEYCLLIYRRRTMDSLAGMRNMKIENGEITYFPLSQEQIDEIKNEIELGVVREMEANIHADSLEEAKRKAIEMSQGFGDIVVKVEERDYSGWGIKF